MYLYKSKSDLTLTAIQFPFLGICACAIIAAPPITRGDVASLFAADKWKATLLWILILGVIGIVPLVISSINAYKISQNAWMALPIFILRYFYAAVMVGLGSIALLIGLVTLPRRGSAGAGYLRDDMSEEVGHFTRSKGIGATLWRFMGRLNQKVIRSLPQETLGADLNDPNSNS